MHRICPQRLCLEGASLLGFPTTPQNPCQLGRWRMSPLLLGNHAGASETTISPVNSRRNPNDVHNSGAIEVLDRVQIMTPENIHLNSFMYEPIVDMSGEHLRKLYADVLAL
jgi:hypothetical protein